MQVPSHRNIFVVGADCPQEHCLEYTRQLEKGGKFTLCVWPEHCLVSTIRLSSSRKGLWVTSGGVKRAYCTTHALFPVPLSSYNGVKAVNSTKYRVHEPTYACIFSPRSSNSLAAQIGTVGQSVHPVINKGEREMPPPLWARALEL